MGVGSKIAAIMASALDAHFEGEIKAYCERHSFRPEEVEVNIQPGGKDTLRITMGPKELRLIVPKRVFKFIAKLEGETQ